MGLGRMGRQSPNVFGRSVLRNSARLGSGRGASHRRTLCVTRPFGLTLVGVKGAWAVVRLVSQKADQPAFETPVAVRGVSNRVALTWPL